MAALLVAAYARLLRSPWGAAMRAVRDSETAAASIGIDPTYVRIVAFMISAGCAALAGGLSAPINAFVTPHAFDLNLSIVLVLVVIIGGAGRTAGPVLGAVVVGLIPELLSAFEAYRVLAYGALVLVVLWIAPQGLAGLIPARRTDDAQPAPPDRIDLGALLGTHGRRDLDARGLSLSFGGVKAIDAVDLAIPAGAVTALIGPNGAGKSTLVNMLSGFYRPDAGERRLGDAPLDAAGSWRVARSGIARTYQASLLFESLSVEANLLLAMRRGRLGSPLGPALDRPSAERNACASPARGRELCRRRHAAAASGLLMSTAASSRSPARWRPARTSSCSTSLRPAFRKPRSAGSANCCAMSPGPASGCA